MQVQPLGTGGAFSELETCYLVNECVLIDCGPSAIKRTFNDGRADKITHVFLSHIHNDHVGGFETLYYYRKYVAQDPIVEVYCPGEYYKLSQHLACMNKEFGHKEDLKYNFLAYHVNTAISIDTPHGPLSIRPMRVKHSILEAYAFELIDLITGNICIISGDTDGPIEVNSPRYDLMFHDIGWEGLPASADKSKVHPRESELVGRYGADAPIVAIHTSTSHGVYPRAQVDKIYKV